MIYATSDWHIGEQAAPYNYSHLRPRPTEVMVEEWMAECHDRLTASDTLIFLGDAGLTLEDFSLLRRLPECERILILGNKEDENPHFSLEQLTARNAQLGIFSEIHKSLQMTISGIPFFLGHKPRDCVSATAGTQLPALCGHIHGTWRSQQMPNGQPILNVGIDAWHQLVSERLILHQYDAVMQHYDDDCFPARWFKGA